MKSLLQKLTSPNIPIRPQAFPFFYGWIIAITSVIVIVASIPGQTMGVSVFTDYFIETLGLTRLQLSTAYLFGTVASSFVLPWSGRVFDRIGARLLLVFACLGLGLVLFFLSICNLISTSITSMLTDSSAVIISFAVIFMGFFMLRFTGQGIMAMASRAMVGKWFNRKIGFVTGITSPLVALGFSIAPLSLNIIIETFTWRGAYVFLGLTIGLGISVFVWIFARDNPEECGLTLDGAGEAEKHERKTQLQGAKKEFTVLETRRNYSFRVFNFALSFHALYVTAFTFHVVSLGAEGGLQKNEILGIFIPLSIVSTLINMLSGWISDHIKLKYLLMVQLITLIIGLYGLLQLHTVQGYLFIVVGIGTAQGIWNCLITITWPRFYGRRHIGAISGFNMSCVVFGSALGPVLFAISFQYMGSYSPAVIFCALVPVVNLLAAIKADNPQEKIA